MVQAVSYNNFDTEIHHHTATLKDCQCHEITRSQAVARIADRTAKDFRGHVTRPRPLSGKLFVRLLGIPSTKLHTKFEVSSSSSFRDIAM